ncbi:zinc ribbon domain-containing protein [Salinirubellus sp. GCM10025818]|uniref:zinc ribbon domain-containing protein n=1 Tax=Salinirubellus TaxID=2162630 RepID=UPI0030CF8014
MRESISRKRPWLAALLAAVATGLGHLYLRRWGRAAGWLAVLSGVTVFLVDPAAVDALVNGGPVDPAALAPILVVGGLSVVDAYLLAHVQNALARLTVSSGGRLTHCPSCGRELDPDIEFCQWCAAEDVEPMAVPTDRPNDREETP